MRALAGLCVSAAAIVAGVVFVSPGTQQSAVAAPQQCRVTPKGGHGPVTLTQGIELDCFTADFSTFTSGAVLAASVLPSECVGNQGQSDWSNFDHAVSISKANAQLIKSDNTALNRGKVLAYITAERAWYAKQHPRTAKAKKHIRVALADLAKSEEYVTQAMGKYSATSNTLDSALTSLGGHNCGVDSTMADAKTLAVEANEKLATGMLILRTIS